MRQLEALSKLAGCRSATDCCVLALHGCLLDSGYTLECTDEAGGMSKAGDGSVVRVVLLPSWNANSDAYAFNYTPPSKQGVSRAVVKAIVIGNTLSVHAVEQSLSGGKESALLNYEITPSEVLAKKGEDLTAHLDADGSLVDAFKDLKAIETAFRRAIVDRLSPAAAATSETKPAASASHPAAPPQPPPMSDPLRDERFPPWRPDSDLGDPPLGMGGPGYFGPDGNLVGPRDPMFGGGMPGGVGAGRGRGNIRFDPLGPFPGRGIDPDNDHLRPSRGPGFQEDMYG
ncbi:unnamed protein product [Vitrella brassicaformis CCMP3155]|uniref:PI31 proteasome regulator N-terminal domain-containing protein n=2 Tax=Vitrella brassicaformis TaxID=1169539 RepID=A0A0G4FMI9_VITBC|nr:unnamed protein product [Vitrella brassicaformis CCMP3155]|eukprot:CEM14785.1 unnamed protein product [Vitrella brassicaformis CCMP3155]